MSEESQEEDDKKGKDQPKLEDCVNSKDYIYGKGVNWGKIG